MNGYSLLELVVAMALLGFISIAMSGGIQFGARAWEASETKVEAQERLQGAQTLLRTVLQRAMPRELDPSFAVDLDLFRGSAGELAFTASAPSAFGAEGLVRFELRVDGEPGAQRLVLLWQSVNSAAPAQNRVLVAGAASVGLSYGARDQVGGLVWTEDWQGRSGAPAAVAIRVNFPQGSGQFWPPFVARTRITHDPLCVYNADTFGCPHA